MAQTLDDIRREGLKALRERLGTTGMVRFLQLFDGGSGDYAVSRRAWADSVSMDAIRKARNRISRKSKTRSKKTTTRKRRSA